MMTYSHESINKFYKDIKKYKNTTKTEAYRNYCKDIGPMTYGAFKHRIGYIKKMFKVEILFKKKNDDLKANMINDIIKNPNKYTYRMLYTKYDTISISTIINVVKEKDLEKLIIKYKETDKKCSFPINVRVDKDVYEWYIKKEIRMNNLLKKLMLLEAREENGVIL